MESSAPIDLVQERANAITHGSATVLWFVVGGILWSQTSTTGDRVACGVYVLSVIAVFLCSTCSHTFLKDPWLERFRAWDQATIYGMIVGTYTPIAWTYATPSVRGPLIAGMWIAAAIGFAAKVALRHRVNKISVVSYLMLGWLPALPLIGEVPAALALTMLAGGVTYTIGVAVLLNDHRSTYVHAVWHLLVLAASLIHAWGIWTYVLA